MAQAPLVIKITTRTKLSRAFADKMCERIRGHVTRTPAAEALGVHRRTLWEWLTSGQAASACTVEGCTDLHHGPDGDLSYADFAMLVMRAEADAAFLMAGRVSQASVKDWRAASWWLERRLPEDFGERTRVELSGPAGGPIEVDARHLLIEKIERIASRVVETEPLRRLP